MRFRLESCVCLAFAFPILVSLAGLLHGPNLGRFGTPHHYAKDEPTNLHYPYGRLACLRLDFTSACVERYGTTTTPK